MTKSTDSSDRPLIAFGPELAGVGSWEWNGADLVEQLSADFRTVTFAREVPRYDVLVIVKYNLPLSVVQRVARDAAVIFVPVDYYGSSAEIDRDARMLRCCSRILVHCERLRKYFQSYAPVESIDHHVRFIAEPAADAGRNPNVLWVGMRTNLPPLAAWVHSNPLPGELQVLTNLDGPAERADPADFGFQDGGRVRIEAWNPRRHVAAAAAGDGGRRTPTVRAAIQLGASHPARLSSAVGRPASAEPANERRSGPVTLATSSGQHNL